MSKRVRPKVKLYPLISRAVEEGVAYGLQRYNKYNSESPVDVDIVAEHVEREVLNALCEVLEFDA
jgi:hypothetical protein